MLRLLEDVLSNDAAVLLPAMPRMVFAVHGSVTVGDRVLQAEEAWSGEDAVTLEAGGDGATVWRWELLTGDADRGISTGPGIASREKLSARLSPCPKARCFCGAIVWPSRRAAAPICTAIKDPASVAWSKAESASIRTTARRHTVRAALGTRADRIRSSLKPRTGRAGSFAS